MIHTCPRVFCQERQSPSLNLIEFKIIPVRAYNKTLNTTFIPRNILHISM